MAYMKSLTVSGQTYQVKDPEAVCFTAQQLTSAQQTQARENLGVLSKEEVLRKLCPSFTESGAVVTCKPVEGSSLVVATQEDATKVTRCGKNLLSTSMVEDPAANQSKTIYSGTLNAPFTIRADFSQATVNGASGAGFLTCTVDGVDSNLNWTMLEAGFTKTAGTLTRVRLVNWNNTTGVVKMQLEAGSVATEWEPHKTAEVFTPGEAIPALPGVNTIFADTGLITVTGKADPVAIIEKLTDAVRALGGDV